MFLSIGYLFMYINQAFWWKVRQLLFKRTLAKVTRQPCSFIIQQSRDGMDNFLSGLKIPVSSLDLFETQTLNGSTTLSLIKPQINVNLSDWTKYFALKEWPDHDNINENFNIILQASRPDDVDDLVEMEDAIPADKKVHAHDHGTAIAWVSGPPFCFLMHCSVDEVTSLCLGFSEGLLTLDEDLIVNRILCVQTEGVPRLLINETDAENIHEEADVLHPITQRDVQASLLRIQQKRLGDTTSYGWSNESLASELSGRNSLDFLDASETGSRRGYSASEAGDLSIQGDDLESGCGEAPCEVELGASSLEDSHAKPPNILIYCGKKDSMNKFKSAKASLEQCINTDSYVIYMLKNSDVSLVPWKDNTALLVLSCNRVSDKNMQSFLNFFEAGGKILSFGSQFDAMFVARHDQNLSQINQNGVIDLNYKTWNNVKLMFGSHVYRTTELTGENVTVEVLGSDNSGNAVIVDVRGQNGGHAILSQVLIERDPTVFANSDEAFDLLKQSNSARFEIFQSLLQEFNINTDPSTCVEPTQCYLLWKSQDTRGKFLKSIDARLKEDGMLKSASSLQLQFVENLNQNVSATTESYLPIFFNPPSMPELSFFSLQEYWKHLNTNVLGNSLFVADVMHTTSTVFQPLQFSVPDNVGMIAIAGRQTRGKGRGGNSWLSPVGGAYFSLHVKLPVDSHLGKHASFIQHITALAVVKSVQTIPGYENIEMRLKWPNDIYYSNKMKMGGILVTSTIMDNDLHANIGCGFNVANTNPTICINDLVERMNSQQGTSLPPLNSSQLIARTVTVIEELIDHFQKHGSESFCQQYYDKWLHSDQRVYIDYEKTFATIVGLDEYGFLLVKDEKGNKLTLQPDGNSFDMMANLITLKST